MTRQNCSVLGIGVKTLLENWIDRNWYKNATGKEELLSLTCRSVIADVAFGCGRFLG